MRDGILDECHGREYLARTAKGREVCCEDKEFCTHIAAPYT